MVKTVMSSDSAESELDSLSSTKDQLKIQQRLIDISLRNLQGQRDYSPSSRSSCTGEVQSTIVENILFHEVRVCGAFPIRVTHTQSPPPPPPPPPPRFCTIEIDGLAFLLYFAQNKLLKGFSRQLLAKHRFIEQSSRGGDVTYSQEELDDELDKCISLDPFLNVAELSTRTIKVKSSTQLKHSPTFFFFSCSRCFTLRTICMLHFQLLLDSSWSLDRLFTMYQKQQSCLRQRLTKLDIPSDDMENLLRHLSKLANFYGVLPLPLSV